MASNDEIHANRESCPRLAMLGKTHLTARDFGSIVDGQVIVCSSSYQEAVPLLFSVYYIFNIQYSDKAELGHIGVHTEVLKVHYTNLKGTVSGALWESIKARPEDFKKEEGITGERKSSHTYK